MYEFNFSIDLKEISDPNYNLIVSFVDAEDWGEFNYPQITVDSGITYVAICLIENGNSVPDMEIPLTKPEDADHIEVTVKAVDEDGNSIKHKVLFLSSY